MDNDYPTSTFEANKARITKRAYHTILLHLLDDVLTAMNHVKTADTLWKVLESNYLEFDIHNRIISLHKLFSYKFAPNKTVN